MSASVEQLVSDPIARIVLQHEERIRVLETYMKIGVGVASAALTVLGGILITLLAKG